MSLLSWLKSKVGQQAAKPPLELREGTAEFELFIARAELETGNDLSHGLQHLACLLDYDPAQPEWRQLLDDYLRAIGDDAEGLLPGGDERYYANEALRAFIRQRQGQTSDAVRILAAVTQAKSDSLFALYWLPEWLEPPAVLESLDPGVAALALTCALNSSPEHAYQTNPRRRALERFVPLVERYLVAFSAGETESMMIAGLLRKAGHFDRALAFLQQASEQGDDWHLATAEGLVRRQVGEVDRAEEAFGRAVRLEPERVSTYLEAGDTFFERGLWSRAGEWYDRVLQMEPDHAWARPSSLFVRWSHDQEAAGDDAEVPFPEALQELHQAGNSRAASIMERYLPYDGYLPEPADAAANVQRQYSDKLAAQAREAPADERPVGATFSVAVTCIEPPSNHTAFKLQMAALGRPDDRLEVTAQAIPSPDPRLPVEPVDFQLWSFDGVTPSPALPVPAPEVGALIAGLAAQPYDIAKNWAEASFAAEQLSPDRAADVLATMIHPEPVPEGTNALAWLPRVQLAAAMVLAHLGGGWQGSVRRRALFSLLLGPRDWTTEAAIIALGHLAREEPAHALDIHNAFQRLDDATPDQGFWGYRAALYSNWLQNPILLPREEEELRAKYRQFLDESD